MPVFLLSVLVLRLMLPDSAEINPLQLVMFTISLALATTGSLIFRSPILAIILPSLTIRPVLTFKLRFCQALILPVFIRLKPAFIVKLLFVIEIIPVFIKVFPIFKDKELLAIIKPESALKILLALIQALSIFLSTRILPLLMIDPVS